MQRDFDPGQPELMDLPQPLSTELEADLANIRRLNRRFGAYRLVRKFLGRWMQTGGTYRVLDMATGSGDIPRLMIDWAKERGIMLRVDAVDFHPATLEVARNLSVGYSGIDFVRADARTFYREEKYDIVCCSLALHHFSEEDAVAILRRCRDLSRRHVLVADLERSLWTSAGVFLVTALLYREPMTKHDGRLSARRAFSFSEFHGLAERAAWENFGHCRFRPARQAIWLE